MEVIIIRGLIDALDQMKPTILTTRLKVSI